VRLLEKRGHQVTVVNTGRQAVAAAFEQSFDAILMDVQMPEMDGFEATAAIREKEKSSGTHRTIIAMTAHAMKGDRERCLGAGMDGYVSKPLQPDALYAAVEGQPAAPGAAPAPVPVTAPVEPAALDEAVLLEHFGNDTGLLKEIAGIFVANCSTWQFELRSAAEALDATRLQLAAHTVKGAVGHFGDQEAYDAAYRLELMGKGRDLHGAAAACADLNRALQRLQAALRPLCEPSGAGL